METKKSLRADLRNKRALLLEIGMIVALVLVIVAFAHKSETYRPLPVAISGYAVESDVIPVTREKTEQRRTVEVPAVSDLLEIVDNRTTVQTEILPSEWEAFTTVDVVLPAVDEEVVDDEPFVVAERMPSFQGGDLDTFRRWVMQNVKYPQIALENGIRGRVVLEFVIERDGRLTNIRVLQTPDRTLSEEAARVLASSPRWSPGMQRNREVRVKYTLPVDFRM